MFPSLNEPLLSKIEEALQGDGKFEEVIESILKVSKALSCDTKVGIILLLLKDGEKAVNEIAAALNRDITLISHHLSDLKKLGFVKERRVGKLKLYSIKPDKLGLVRALIEHSLL